MGFDVLVCITIFVLYCWLPFTVGVYQFMLRLFLVLRDHDWIKVLSTFMSRFFVCIFLPNFS